MDYNHTAQQNNSLVIEDGQNLIIDNQLVAPQEQPAINIIGNNAQLGVTPEGQIFANDEGNTAVLSSGNYVDLVNYGQIWGEFNGVDSNGNNLNLINQGVISSNSRAVQLDDGDNLNLLNTGEIIGTGNQRNGTLYINGGVDNANILNQGIIDAGEGYWGDGFSTQVGVDSEDASSENINLVNDGWIAGRGQAEFDPEAGRLTPNGSSGVRFFNGLEDGAATLTGSVVNNGSITAEVEVGFLGGVVVENGVGFAGTIDNNGSIFAPRNGLYIGNGQHQLTINNTNLIESDSRAVNLNGDNVTFNNTGEAIGTGDQRNGTVYVDGTGDNIAIANAGTIDAGVGNSGSGVSIQVGTQGGLADGSDDLETSVNLTNDGLIQGRGTENAPAGFRLFVGEDLSEASFTGEILNNGTIASETQAGILIESGVIFDGEIVNNGTISGGNIWAIDANDAGGSINVINNGILEGEVRLGNGGDYFVQNYDWAVDVEGGAGSDTLLGGTGNDVLQGDAGADTLTGGGGTDTFILTVDSGHDVITDFESVDILDVSAFYSSTEQVSGTVTWDGYDTTIALGDGDSITLENFAASDLSADNFLF